MGEGDVEEVTTGARVILGVIASAFDFTAGPCQDRRQAETRGSCSRKPCSLTFTKSNFCQSSHVFIIAVVNIPFHTHRIHIICSSSANSHVHTDIQQSIEPPIFKQSQCTKSALPSTPS